MKARTEHLEIATEGLMHADLGSFDLIDGAGAAATDARAPDAETPRHIAAAFEQGLIAGAVELLPLDVLEILLLALVDPLVLLAHYYNLCSKPPQPDETTMCACDKKGYQSEEKLEVPQVEAALLTLFPAFPLPHAQIQRGDRSSAGWALSGLHGRDGPTLWCFLVGPVGRELQSAPLVSVEPLEFGRAFHLGF